MSVDFHLMMRSELRLDNGPTQLAFAELVASPWHIEYHRMALIPGLIK
jgi:hypothetical protein